MATVIVTSSDHAIAEIICGQLSRRLPSDDVIVPKPSDTDMQAWTTVTIPNAGMMLVILKPSRTQSLVEQLTGTIQEELEAAFRANIPVVPVLLNNVEMPALEQCHPGLERFAGLNPIRIRTGDSFRADIEALVLFLFKTVQGLKSRPPKIESRPPAPSAESSFEGLDKVETEKGRVFYQESQESPVLDDLYVPQHDDDIFSPNFAEAPSMGALYERIQPAASALRRPVPRPKRTDSVEFAVSHPRRIRVRVPFLVHAWLYKPTERHIAEGRSRDYSLAQNFQSGSSTSIQRGSQLTIQIDCAPWKAEPEAQTVIWSGNVANVSFSVNPDIDVPGETVIAVCRFSIDGLRIAQIPFELSLFADNAAPFKTTKPIENAFASYASKDRQEVLARVQGIEKLGVRVFMDVRDLKAGDQYPRHLLARIDGSDLLYLFWSRNAHDSEWVNREWRYALQQKGLEFIDPVPLESPRIAPPPPELSVEKHFDDWVLAFTAYERQATVQQLD